VRLYLRQSIDLLDNAATPGVGLLAVSDANVWLQASIVGLDVWEPSLALARAQVSA
jgi:hypothetical protein